jgi:hypothetical protein
VALRRVDQNAAVRAATNGTAPIEAPVYWVCVALLLALATLAARIVSIW